MTFKLANTTFGNGLVHHDYSAAHEAQSRQGAPARTPSPSQSPRDHEPMFEMDSESESDDMQAASLRGGSPQSRGRHSSSDSMTNLGAAARGSNESLQSLMSPPNVYGVDVPKRPGSDYPADEPLTDPRDYVKAPELDSHFDLIINNHKEKLDKTVDELMNYALRPNLLFKDVTAQDLRYSLDPSPGRSNQFERSALRPAPPARPSNPAFTDRTPLILRESAAELTHAAQAAPRQLNGAELKRYFRVLDMLAAQHDVIPQAQRMKRRFSSNSTEPVAHFSRRIAFRLLRNDSQKLGISEKMAAMIAQHPDVLSTIEKQDRLPSPERISDLATGYAVGNDGLVPITNEEGLTTAGPQNKTTATT